MKKKIRLQTEESHIRCANDLCACPPPPPPRLMHYVDELPIHY